MTSPADDAPDPLDYTPDTWPGRPGGGGPDQPITDAVAQYEAAHARRGWDQAPQLLALHQEPSTGLVAVVRIAAPVELLHGPQPYLAAAAAALVIKELVRGLGADAARAVLPRDVVAVGMLHEAWGVAPDPTELDHLKKLRTQRKLWTRPDRIELRYVTVVDLHGNECDVIRYRGTDGAQDHVEVQTWPAARAVHYRGDAVDAVRGFARAVSAVFSAAAGP
jgi:hypothetical protein